MYKLVKKDMFLVENIKKFGSKIKKKKEKSCGKLFKRFFASCYIFEPEKESEIDKVQINFMKATIRLSNTKNSPLKTTESNVDESRLES
jgi:hypothetical protein